MIEIKRGAGRSKTCLRSAAVAVASVALTLGGAGCGRPLDSSVEASASDQTEDARATQPNQCIPTPEVGVQWTHVDGTPAPQGAPDSVETHRYRNAEGDEYTVSVSPKGWNAQAHSDEENQRVGLPPRPVDATRLAEWKSSAGRLRSVAGAPCQNPDATPLANLKSMNWSGILLNGGSGAYSQVQSGWTQPNFVFHCSGRSDQAIWVGLGGKYGPYLLQTGFETNTGNPGMPGAITDSVGLWEIPPAKPNFLPEIPLAPGQVASASVSFTWAFGGVATFQLVNWSTGTVWTANVITTRWDGTSVEIINEAPDTWQNRKQTNATRFSNTTYNGGIPLGSASAFIDTYYRRSIDDSHNLEHATFNASTNTGANTWDACS